LRLCAERRATFAAFIASRATHGSIVVATGRAASLTVVAVEFASRSAFVMERALFAAGKSLALVPSARVFAALRTPGALFCDLFSCVGGVLFAFMLLEVFRDCRTELEGSASRAIQNRSLCFRDCMLKLFSMNRFFREMFLC
jgi:hypothetical protein